MRSNFMQVRAKRAQMLDKIKSMKKKVGVWANNNNNKKRLLRFKILCTDNCIYTLYTLFYTY
jgi:hypothetical protein